MVVDLVKILVPLTVNNSAELIPKDMRLVDPAIGLAQHLDGFLGKPKIPVQKPVSFSNTRFCATSDPIGFSIRTRSLLGN